MYEKNDFFDYLRDYWRRFCFFLGSIATWIGIFWKPVAIGTGVLAVLGLALIGAYALATAGPTEKISVAFGGILFWNFSSGLVSRYFSKGEQDVKKKTVFGCLGLFVMAISIYGLILSLFVLPWPVSDAIVCNFVFAIVLVLVEEKKKDVKIPKFVIWIRNGLFIYSLIGMGYYLAKIQGWI